MSIIFSSATQLAAAIRSGDVSAVEVMDAHLASIEEHNPALNAIITMDADAARQRARAADQALASGEVSGPLHGVPFTLKDSHSTAGMRTTAGFPPLADYVPQTDSTVAARLKAAGGILIGKTNVPTMLVDIQSDNPIFGRTLNPWNTERTPGGSSGGSVAAVAAGFVPFYVGSDIGGSIRLPAHFCGVFGLKTTENRVSQFGHIPGLPDTPHAIARILASIGPIARSVDDLALIYGIIAGPDGYNVEVAPVPVTDPPELALGDLRIAFAPAFPGIPTDPDIRAAITSLADQLEPLCGVVGEALPEADFVTQQQAGIQLTATLLSAFQPDPEAPQPTLAEYMQALYERDRQNEIWENFLDEWDVLLCPTAALTAFRHQEMETPVTIDGQTCDYWTVNAPCKIFNYTGHPAVVIPIGHDRDGLPIGVQIVGKRWSESRLLAIARAISEVAGPFQRPPGY